MIINRRTALAFLAVLVLAPLAANAKAADAPRYTLVVYTFRAPGVCPACDRARSAVARLANEYPIEFAYRDDPSGAALANARNVTAFPTFTVVRRDAAGEREVERWLGAQNVELRIRAAFARRGIKPGTKRARP